MSHIAIGGEAAVILEDGAYIPEPWPTGGFSSLPIDKISRVLWRDTEGRLFAVTLLRDIYPDIRPIFFRRMVGSLAPGISSEASDLAVCLGWQATVNGKNVQSHTYVFADGTTLITDRHIREFREGAFSGSPNTVFDKRIIPLLRD